MGVFFFACPYFLATLHHVGSRFPDQGSTPSPLHWKDRVLTTGSPAKSLNISFKILNQITKQERILIRDTLKRMTLTVSKVLEKEAFVTNSGVKRKEINPDTFESKIVDNLFIVGELIEGCGISGGFNLQQAYSTGVTAAKTIKERLK